MAEGAALRHPFALLVDQQAPLGPLDPASGERQQLPLLPDRLGEPFAHQRHPEPGAGRLQQQAGIGEVEPPGLQLQILPPFQRPVVPVQLSFTVQGSALCRRLGQHGRRGHRQQPVRQQWLMATLGLGGEIPAQGEIYGLFGQIGHLVAGEEPKIDVGVLAMKRPQSGQQPVAGDGGAGVEHQLVRLAVLF
ncbi:hypothetical protein D3C77_294450 [compost metagenome]